MKSIELAEVSALGPYIRSTDEPLVVTENGQTIAAIIPTDDADLESLLLSINPQFENILERSQQRLESEGGLSSDEVRERLGIKG